MFRFACPLSAFLFVFALGASAAPVCTPNAPELIASFPEDTSKHAVMRLAVPDVRKGDVFLVTGEMEASNDTSQWARFSRAILYSPSASAVSPAGGGAWVTEANEENFNPVPKSCWIGRCDVYHLVAVKVGIVTIPADAATGYFSFLAWSATDPAQPSWQITVNKGYGRMCAVKLP